MAVVSALQAVREEIANRLNEVESDNTDLYTNWVNLCFNDVEASMPEAPFLRTSADRTLSAGTRQYAAAANFRKMNKITLPAAEITLSYLEPEHFDLLNPSATDGGNPTVYTIRGYGANAIIEYFPVGAVTVHQEYQRRFATVSAGSASIDLPEQYFELPILYGEMRGLRRRGKYTEAQQVANEYAALKEKMRSELMSQTTEMKRVKSVREFQRNGRYTDPVINEFWGN